MLRSVLRTSALLSLNLPHFYFESSILVSVLIVYLYIAIIPFNDVASALPKAGCESKRAEKRKRMVAGRLVGTYWAKRQDHSSN